MFNPKITVKEVPKIAAVAVVLLAVTGIWVVKAHSAAEQQENTRLIQHMSKELGMPVNQSDTPQEPQDHAQDDEKESADAKLHTGQPQ